MLTEKYRPKSFTDIVGQEKVISEVRELIKNQNSFPPLLFEGRAGIGKTAMSYVIAQEMNADLTEYNVSDYRGIDDMRDKIVPTFKYAFSNKVIYLDEADMMTPEAQRLLRKPLEKYHKTNVIMSCNYIDEINEPIRSRCKEFHFEPIPNEKIEKRLIYIAKMENVEDKVDVEEITENADGDLRKAINNIEGRNDIKKANDELKEIAQQYQ